ncbi:MOS1T transposase, partial [Pseudoatta argentina]
MSIFVPNKVYLQGILLHYFIQKKSAAEAYRILVQTYGDNALSDTTCRDWFRRFKTKNKRHPPQDKRDALPCILLCSSTFVLTCFSSRTIGLILAPGFVSPRHQKYDNIARGRAQSFIEPSGAYGPAFAIDLPRVRLVRASSFGTASYLCAENALLNPSPLFRRIASRRAYVSPIAPAERIAPGATGIKFFALKRYLPDGGGRYLYSADYKGINGEQLDFSGRTAPHSRGRSSRAHPEIRLPHEGAAQVENGTAAFAAVHCSATFCAIVCRST